MAVSYRSIATGAFTDMNGAAPSITITKPTGLTAGDYMVAIIGFVDADRGTGDAISGWTLLEAINNSNCSLYVYGKTADAGDAAASNFTFAIDTGTGGANDYIVGGLIAISGTAPISNAVFVNSGSDSDGGTTNVFANTITPTVADSILIMGVLGQHTGGAGVTTSNYAVATDNPTWTERYDTTVNDTTDYTFAIATGPRSAVTATGNSQADFSSATTFGAGVVIAVLETTNVTVNPSVISLVGSVQSPSVTGSATVTIASPVSLTANIVAPTVTVSDAKWSTTNKSNTSPTITNVNKS